MKSAVSILLTRLLSLISFFFLSIHTEAQTITIPVVVHVLWKTSAENISDAQVQSQIDVLNEDFGRINADTINTPAVWQSIAANTEIQFCLAQTDPLGNPTTGIVHVQTTVNSFTNDDAVKFHAQGGDDSWDATRYFNIWVCNLGNGFIGYAAFPSFPQNIYGVVMKYNVFGRIGNIDPSYNKGRSTTHEIAHCFNLSNLAPVSNCVDNDSVPDTPTPSVASYGCPTYPLLSACNPVTGDMFMNFMAYTDDSCMNLFTLGQKQRMRAVLTSPPYNSLSTSNVCNYTGINKLNNISPHLVFPNPSGGKFIVEAKGDLIIYNLYGKRIFQQKLISGKSEIDLSNYSKGIYFIYLSSEKGEIFTGKIILE